MTDPADNVLQELTGGAEVCDWFGYVHTFHDAEMLRFDASIEAGLRMRLHAWNMTPETDAQGFYILDKHAVVEVRMGRIDRISLRDFHDHAIIERLAFLRKKDAITVERQKTEDAVEIAWDGVCGVHGNVLGRDVALSPRPGEPTEEFTP